MESWNSETAAFDDDDGAMEGIKGVDVAILALLS